MKSLKVVGTKGFSLLVSILFIFDTNAQHAAEQVGLELNQLVLDQRGSYASCGGQMFTDNIEPIRRDFYGGSRLELTDHAGSIRISSWTENENTILINAEKKVSFSCPPPSKPPKFFLDQLDVEVFGDANKLTVNSIFPQPTPSGVSLSLDYEVTIPKRASLRIINAAGDVVIRSIVGSMDVDLSAGKIDVSHPVYPESADVIDLRVVAGTVILALPTESAFDLDASVTVGMINVGEHLLTVNSTLLGANVKESVNGGGTSVIIRVETGAIKLGGT